MPRTTKYVHSFTQLGIRYRWELIPATANFTQQAEGFTATAQIGDTVLLEDGISISAEYKEQFPLGLPSVTECKLVVDIDGITDTDLRSYIVDPDGGGSVLYSRDGALVSLYGNPNFGAHVFATSNVWTLYSDRGDATLTDTEFAVLFQGVQKRSDSMTISDGVVELLLTDIVTHILSTTPTDVVAAALLADNIDAGQYEEVNADDYTINSTARTYDILYADADGAYGSCHLRTQLQRVTGTLITTSVYFLEVLHFYRWDEIMAAIHGRVLKPIYTAYTRTNNAVISVDGSPTSALTFYRLDYEASLGRGSALSDNELWLPAFIQLASSEDAVFDSADFVAGYCYRADENSMQAQYGILRDWLHDTCESLGVMVVQTPAAEGVALSYRRVKEPQAALELAGNDIVGDTPVIDVRYERLSACDYAVEPTAADDIGEGSYQGAAGRSDADYLLRFTLHNMPSLPPDDALAQDGTDHFTSPTDAHIVRIDTGHNSARFHYFDTPSFATGALAILVHRTVDISTGSGSAVNYGTSLVLPVLDDVAGALTAGMQRAIFRTYIARFLRSAAIEMQRNDSLPSAMARFIVNTFSSATQSRIEAEVDALVGGEDIAGLPRCGTAYEFDPAALVRSYYTGLPTTYYATKIEHSIQYNSSKITLLGY